MALTKGDIIIIQKQIERLANKIVVIENDVKRIDQGKDFDYQKVLSAVKYLYRYYDDMNKDKQVEITSWQQ